MTLSPQWLDELRSRTTLSTLIGRSVKVQRAGREYKACCPFHNEKTPSFTINDEKGFYHCFGCGAHGDAIRWMTDQQGLQFMDAVKELAAEAGMDVPAPDPRAAKQAEQRASLHDVMQAAQDWFVSQLNGIGGSHAREYLKRRGFRADTVSDFGFGFAPDGRNGVARALSQFKETELIEAGLLIAVDGKQPYDRFRGRLMIPIRDARGRVIAFGGRILGDGEPKYLNSPDTPLFDKGRTLYNLDKASPASRQSGRAIVVEGYMDAIALSQAGFGEVVAPLGTALTEHQIERLWKMVEAPLLCFDGDNAGKKAAMRAATRALPMLRPGHSLRFVALPAGLDPDDLVKQSGPQAFTDLAKQAKGLLDFLWSSEFTAHPLTTPEEKAGLKARLLAHADTISNEDVRGLYIREFRERFNRAFYTRAPDKPLGGFGKRFGKGHVNVPSGPHDETRRRHADPVSRDLCIAVLGGLIRYPTRISGHLESLAQYRAPTRDLAELLNVILSATADVSALDTETLGTILQDRGLAASVRQVQRADNLYFSFNRPATESASEISRAERDLDEAIAVLTARPAIESALAEATRRFEVDLEEEFFIEQQRLRVRKQEFDKRLAELADRGGEF